MELIKIEKREGKETVNARELHELLGPKRDFPTWISSKITIHDFEKEKDFTTIMGKSTGGRPSTEYFISTDMAKELCMLEGNGRGKEARRWFIERDNKLKQIESSLPSTFAEALQLAADQAKQIEQQTEQLAIQAPAVDFHNKIQSSPDSISISMMARLITKNGYEIGRNRLYKYMRHKKYLISNSEPYQTHMTSGLFEVEPVASHDFEGGEYIRNRVLITGKGQIHFCKLLAPTPKTDNIQMEIINAE